MFYLISKCNQKNIFFQYYKIKSKFEMIKSFFQNLFISLFIVYKELLGEITFEKYIFTFTQSTQSQRIM